MSNEGNESSAAHKASAPQIDVLDPVRCYRALRNRDRRFDGRFFVGVRTTGIFCRPICPAPSPKPGNCTYWPSVAAAQSAGFRPCLRCRPEAAPGTPAWTGTAATVTRAIRLIEAGGLDGEGSVDELADRLGMGARQLRRLFVQHVGATPAAVAKMRRTLFAKQLIDETTLPMAEVARSAGFNSQRRFNACLREVYGRAPNELRRQRESPHPSARATRDRVRASATKTEGIEQDSIVLCIAYRPPIAWGALLDFLSVRAIPGVEHVEGGCYFRTVRSPDGTGSIRISNEVSERKVLVALRMPSSAGVIDISTRVRQLFDLDADIESIDATLASQDLLRRQIDHEPGIRVPGAYNGFETAVRGILGQQVSVKAATTLSGRIAERWGRKVPRRFAPHDSLRVEFPGPEQLRHADLEEIGLPRTRAETIRTFADAVVKNSRLIAPGPGLESSIADLTVVPGIGPWTANYIAMRVHREPDALPAGDLGLRKVLTRPMSATVNAREVESVLEGCRPYRAYAAIRLWRMLETLDSTRPRRSMHESKQLRRVQAPSRTH